MDQFSVYRSSKMRRDERRLWANRCHSVHLSSFQNPAVENQMPRPFGKQLWECVTNYLDVPVYLSNNSGCYGPCQLVCLTSTTKVGVTHALCSRSFPFLFLYLLQNSHICISEKTMLHSITEKWLFKNTDNQKLGQVTGAVYCYLLATHDAVVTEMKYLRAQVLSL